MKGLGKITNYELRITSLENILLFLFLLLIPIQLGKHFWPEWSMVMGVRVDYLSPTLYLVDIVWGMWMGTRLITNWRKVLNFQNILMGLFVVLNVLVAGNRWVAVYRWVRIAQLALSYKFIKLKVHKVEKYLEWIIPCWIILETMLGMAQIVKGGSLQGIWYWLGERRFSYASIGVAQISLLGQGLVRAYGTFSHPNSLAGFLLISLIYWIGNQKNFKFQISNFKFSGMWWWVVVWMGVVGIIISGSRVVWLLAAGLAIVILISNFKFQISNYKKYLGMGLVGMGMVLIVLGMIGINYRIGDFVGGWDSDSVLKRITLNWLAMKMWKEHFLLGIGMGNFTSVLPEYIKGLSFYWWQPVHNIFLLWASETGMLGVLGVVWAGAMWWRKRMWSKWKMLIIAVVVTAMLDHYWLTLPQNSWLMVVMMAII
ncbi:MAG: O-antigen ligase family protein [Microgenomates group bacterium]